MLISSVAALIVLGEAATSIQDYDFKKLPES